MLIELKPWHTECADGCCSEDGTDVYVDGCLVTHHGDLDYILLCAVLNKLGNDVRVIGYDEKGAEAWGYDSFIKDAEIS